MRRRGETEFGILVTVSRLDVELLPSVACAME